MRSAPLHVLVFEDDSADADYLRDILEESHKDQFKLEFVDKLKSGIERLKDYPFDLILLDLSLPDSQGLETFSRLFAHSPDIPLIVLTGNADDHIALKAVQAGAQDYLVKGEVNSQLLARAMWYAIERKKAEEERKRLEAQLQYVQKLESIGVLAGGIAHDFNNLLMTIVANAGLALRALPEDAPTREFMRQIEKAGLRGGELANQMLAYAGKGKPVVQSTDLSKLVKNMAPLLDVSVSKKAVLKYNLDPKLLPINGDSVQLQQVVMNLITNSSEALDHQSGTITCSTGTMTVDRAYISTCSPPGNFPEGVCVYVEVSDTGCGMPPDTVQKMFEPFFTTKFAGRGLGLAAVFGIVRAHAGTINVSSQLDKGSTIRVLFPSAQSIEAKPPATTHGADEWRGTGTILVVEDEEGVRTVTQLILEQVGFQVLTANDGLAGLKLFRQHARELTAVLLDLTMPNMSGEELIEEIRKLDSNVKVIVTSGYTEKDAMARFANKRLNGFIQKPYQIDTLIEKVKQVIS